MENAANALKMAAAIFGFIIAISTLFLLISKVVETSDIVLYYADDTNFYEWENGSRTEGRIVGEDTIISALYAEAEGLTNIYIYDGSKRIYPSSSITDLSDFIKSKLSSGNTYLEKVVEIMDSGNYKQADDGTRITIEPGSSKTYVFYIRN